MKLCADPLHFALPEAESHLVGSEPDPPWTQSRTLPRKGGDPVLYYPGCTGLLPGRGKGMKR